MSASLILEQLLNGIGYGLMLFMLAAGLTLVFGVMNFLNLSHGSLFMVGAYLTAQVQSQTGSFLLAVIIGVVGSCAVSALLEIALARRLYKQTHLAQVLATFGVILVADDLIRIVWGSAPIPSTMPENLASWLELPGGIPYQAYRLMLLGVGVLVAVILYYVVNKTRVGMLVRAGAADRVMTEWMGVPVKPIFTGLFVVGGVLAGLAGALLAPLVSVQPGMGEDVLIPSLVVLVIGGIGSIRGAFIAALLVGLVDTAGRAFLPIILRSTVSPMLASELAPAIAGVAMYALMAGVLIFKPSGMFSAR